jgi:hypothetical protein
MNSASSDNPITIRATFSSYIALSGVWVILALFWFLLSLKNPSTGCEKGVVICGGVTLLWWWWLLGFKITITSSFLEYRDGFYQSSKIALSDIKQIKDENVGWNVLSPRIIVPRLIIISRGETADIRINPKPFSRTDLKKVRQEIGSLNERGGNCD